jgi:hypothetical protein
MTAFFRTSGFPVPGFAAQAHPDHVQDGREPDAPSFPSDTLVDQLAAALNLPEDPGVHWQHDDWPVAPHWLPVTVPAAVMSSGCDDRYGDDQDDLPRLFAPKPVRGQPVALLPRPGRPAIYQGGHASPLSGRTVALGFTIGLALAGPVTWVAALHSSVRGADRFVTASAAGPSPIISTLAPAVDTASDTDGGIAAFDEAGRRIARGDYIGARDLLRRAVAAGEDRARALLNALD